MAELLTTNKLSELACLTLYLMYEKKNGRQSVWYEFIKVRACWHALLKCGALCGVEAPRPCMLPAFPWIRHLCAQPCV